MQIDGYVQALRDDLARVAAVGDESTARAAELLSVALEAAAGRRLLEALGEAALELNSQLENGRVEPAPAEPADEAFTARITLRLPESLKSRLDAAASLHGVSVNTWLVQVLVRTLESRPAFGGGSSRRRLTGYGRS